MFFKKILQPTNYEIKYKRPLSVELKNLGQKVKQKQFLAKVRRFGSFMAGMVIPAIGVLIAWGLFTAILLGIKTEIAYQKNIPINAWTAEHSAKYLFNMDKVIDLGIKFTIPMIIAYLGGRQIYERRGALVGFASVLGVIAYSQISLQSQITSVSELSHKWTFNAIMVQITGDASLINTGSSPMILGALICGPFFAWIFKNIEKLYKNNIKQGFEMLVNNFSLGIFGCFAIFAAFWGIGPLMALFQVIFFFIIKGISDAGLLFFIPVFVEFEKVLFLNNAVNHGILGPLGYQAVEINGYSPLFYLDPNPGKGLGLLVAYMCFGTKEEKSQATAAAPIHFVGGIHEVYYPFILTRPINLLFMMIGGIFEGAMYQIFDFGGIFTPSPGSVIMNYLAVYSAKPFNYLVLTIAIFGSAAIVFALTSFSLLWKNIKNGKRIIFNGTKLKLISKINKSKNYDLAQDINITKKILQIKYEKIKDSNNFLWEIVSFLDGSVEYIPIKNSAKKIVAFRYKTYQKNTTTYVKYLEKFYDKKNFDLYLKENEKTNLNSEIEARIKTIENQKKQALEKLSKWKNEIIAKLNKNDKISHKNLKNDYESKLIFLNFKFDKKIDYLKFKLEKNNYFSAKRIKVLSGEKEIKKIDYEQKQIELLKRTIIFENNLTQKAKDAQKIASLKQEYQNKIAAENVKFKQRQLKQELQEKINQISKVIVDGKVFAKTYFKDQIDYLELDAQKETLKSINDTNDKENYFDVNSDLVQVVQKTRKIIFACEAGMGSSAMGAGMVKKMINDLGIKDIQVSNCAIKDLPADVDIVITQNTFVDFVSKQHKNSYVYGINQFLKKEEYKDLIDTIKKIRAKKT